MNRGGAFGIKVQLHSGPLESHWQAPTYIMHIEGRGHAPSLGWSLGRRGRRQPSGTLGMRVFGLVHPHLGKNLLSCLAMQTGTWCRGFSVRTPCLHSSWSFRSSFLFYVFLYFCRFSMINMYLFYNNKPFFKRFKKPY